VQRPVAMELSVPVPMLGRYLMELELLQGDGEEFVRLEQVEEQKQERPEQVRGGEQARLELVLRQVERARAYGVVLDQKEP